MKRLLSLALCLGLTMNAIAATNNNGYKVMYDGGSLGSIKAGSKAEIVIEANQVHLMRDGQDLTVVPASSITEITYGEDVHRRVGAAIGLATVSLGIGALMLLSKSKKHFIGLTWADGTGKGGFAMQCDKSDYRGILTGLEGVSGKKAVDSAALTVKN